MFAFLVTGAGGFVCVCVMFSSGQPNSCVPVIASQKGALSS